ncbi:hypothetical protein L1987_56884 [Smallanthus sonchifolius]|uniref:Uncharacterized protein n=1 Tax=Smallanthus sonchifolius TaxID=185202 RepID=A0ACB9DBZ2_9ASTR|nr:hypothetical protein L1987_56884 [Smallanthus sonchifolius]
MRDCSDMFKQTPSSWEWINIYNHASRFPTDFGFVAIHDEAVNLVIEEFARLKMVNRLEVKGVQMKPGTSKLPWVHIRKPHNCRDEDQNLKLNTKGVIVSSPEPGSGQGLSF